MSLTTIELLQLNNIIYIPTKNNAELNMHLLKILIADLQNQMNNITSGSGGGGADSNEPDIGTM